MPDEPDIDKPPYLSLTTLTNFFDRLGEGPVPPRIDRSALERYSGATQALLMNALRLMRYVSPDGLVLPSLRDAVNDPVARKAYLEGWARHFYAAQLALAEENGTAQMLQESFAGFGYNGSTLRKAIVFYLQLVEYLGLPNSPHFRAPKQGGTPTAKRRPRTTATPTARSEPTYGSMIYGEPRGETTIVRIDDLATITITVDAQWMKLPVETITSMREAIATLEALDTTDTITIRYASEPQS